MTRSAVQVKQFLPPLFRRTRRAPSPQLHKAGENGEKGKRS